jgi:small-conductance mechanosensitive channel
MTAMDPGLSNLFQRLAPRAELLVYSAIILAVGLLLAALAERATRRLFRQMQVLHVRPSLEANLAITRAVRIVVLAFAIIVILNFWGLGLGGIWSGLLGLLAGIGVALLATWALVSNMTCAVFLSIWRPYRLGDTFEILPEGAKGRAVDRNLMFTVLRQDDGGIVSIPNNLIFQRIVRCYPASEGAAEDLPLPPPDAQGR